MMAQVRTLSSTSTEDTTPIVPPNFDELSDKYLSHSCIRSIIRNTREGSDGPRISEIVSHPLGFHRVYVLTPSLPSEFSLVFNVWPFQSGVVSVGDVHDHCYDFVSKVISGSLTHNLFSAGEEQCGSPRLYARVEYDGGSNRLVGEDSSSLPKQSLVMFESFKVTTGEIYTMSNSCLHYAFASSPNTVSLQLQGPKLNKKATVYKPIFDRNPSVNHAMPKRGDLDGVLKLIESCLG